LPDRVGHFPDVGIACEGHEGCVLALGGERLLLLGEYTGA
jgi:hypothetical protein